VIEVYKRSCLRLARCFVVAAVAILTATSWSSTAQATTPDCLSPHCYAYADFFPSFQLGNISTHIYIESLNDGLFDGQSLIDLEMWASTGTQEWVETGATSGYCSAGVGGCPPSGYVALSWFMADSRSTDGSNYHEHYPSFGTSTFTDYPTGLHYHGNGVWIVQRSDQGGTAGWFTSTGNPNNAANAADAGTEQKENGAIYGCGTEDGLAYQKSGSTTQIFGWSGATLVHPDEPTIHGAWTSTYNNLSFENNSGC